MLQQLINNLRRVIILGIIALFVAELIPVFAFQSLAYQQPSISNSSISSNNTYNWSGYAATHGIFTAVGGSWIVPNVSDSDNLNADTTWVGIGGVSSQDLIQAGTQAITGVSGGVSYQAWYEMLPDESQPISMDVKAGDSITALVAQQAPDQWIISIKNNTNGQSFQKTVTYDSSLSSAEWIEEAPTINGSYISISNFGTVKFTNCWAVKNGLRVTPGQAGTQLLNLVNSDGDTLATPSSIDNSGTSFSVSRSDIVSVPVIMSPFEFFIRQWQRDFRFFLGF